MKPRRTSTEAGPVGRPGSGRRPSRVVIWYGDLVSMRRLSLRGLAYVLLPVAWIVGFLLLPMVVLLAMSFVQRGPYGTVVWDFSLENFRRLLCFGTLEWSADYLRILGRSVWIALVTTVVSIAAAYPLSFFIARRPARSRYLWLALVIIPFCTNLVIRTYAWMLILSSRMPPARLVQWLGWIPLDTALYPGRLALYIGMVSSFLPFAVLPIYTNVEKLDWSLVESARDLYAGKRRTFMHAVLPQTLPGLCVAIIFTFIPAMGAFVVPDLLGGAKVWMVGNLIQQQFGPSRDWPFGAAISSALMVVTLAVLLVLRGRAVGIEEGAR